MKINLKTLRRVLQAELKTYKLQCLRESMVDILAKETSSVDQQIDAYLVKMESQTASLPQETVENILAKRSLRFLLEADSNKPEDKPEPAATPEKPADKTDAKPGDKDPRDKVKIERKPNISPGEMASHIARLIQNYDSLLDVKRVVLVRSLKYLTDNQSDDIATQVADTLRSQFQISLDDPYERADEFKENPPVASGGNAKVGP